MVNELSDEYIRKQVELLWKPQKENFQKLIAELNGKVMDYETCRSLEEFFEDYHRIILNSFIETLNKWKEEKQNE